MVTRIDFIFSSTLPLYQTEPVYFIQSHLWEPLTDVRIAYTHGLDNHRSFDVYTDMGESLKFILQNDIRIYDLSTLASEKCILHIRTTRETEVSLRKYWRPHLQIKPLISKYQLRDIGKRFYEQVYDLPKTDPFRAIFFKKKYPRRICAIKGRKQSQMFEIYFGHRFNGDIKRQIILEDTYLNVHIVPHHPMEIMTFDNISRWLTFFMNAVDDVTSNNTARIGMRRFCLYFASWFHLSGDEMLKLREIVWTINQPRSKL